MEAEARVEDPGRLAPGDGRRSSSEVATCTDRSLEQVSRSEVPRVQPRSTCSIPAEKHDRQLRSGDARVITTSSAGAATPRAAVPEFGCGVESRKQGCAS